MKVKLTCKDCGEIFEVDEDQPLKEQIGWQHIWTSGVEERETGCQLKHRTEGDNNNYDW